MSYSVPQLPLSLELETNLVLKKLAKAHQALAELKGVTGIIPNQSILINTLSLQEAKDSSAIENIITTHDELYKSDASAKQFTTHAAKEVHSYAAALRNGYVKVKKSGLLINNGRTGRIINVLYLVKCGLLDSPVLYLSRYINQNKSEYYRLLQAVRDQRAWEAWVLYMLEGIEQTSRQTTRLIQGIRDLMQHHKHRMRDELPKIYSQDLLINLFKHPYTKIDFVTDELQIHRNTAVKYLEELVRIKLLTKHKLGKDNFYLNSALFNLLAKAGRLGSDD